VREYVLDTRRCGGDINTAIVIAGGTGILIARTLLTISVTNRSHHLHTAKSTLFMVSKDEWDTKEGTGKSMKSTFYEQQCLKRYLSG